MGSEFYFAIAFMLSSAFVLQSLASHEDEPVVETTLGPIRGLSYPFSARFLKRYGAVDGYFGIPYAKPPVGERRFQPAVPMDPWSGTLNATEPPPMCPQITDSETSEDCLQLSVYVPSTAPPNAPVMVWIHGGGFFEGGASLYDSTVISVIGEVIVVTINYRLNILGFLSTGDDAIPANLGLLDQRLALRWVYENIAAFGGNPDMITIFGESAGSVSVGLQLLAPESRQFFQRAILQSGNPFDPWATPISPDIARETAMVVAAAGDCLPVLPGDTAFIADCLRSKTAEELIELFSQVHNDRVQGIGTAFPPVDDGQFLQNDFATLIQEGDFGNVDVIIGTNEDEGTFHTWLLSGISPTRPFFSKEHFALSTLLQDNPLAVGLLEAIYSNGIDDTMNYVDALSDLSGDILFTCGSVNFAKLISEAGSQTYMYRMTIEPLESLTGATWVGATHAEDLQFVFGFPFSSETPVYDELKLSLYVIQMWTNFAKSGNPNLPVALPKSVPEWPEFSAETEFYKELDVLLPNNQRLRPHQCNFWSNLVPEILQLQAIAASGST